MKFLGKQDCLQFRRVEAPNGARFVHLEFNQPEVSEEPLHAGAGKGSFVGRISDFKGSEDVHFHDNRLIGNRRLGMGYCGGRRWLIENNLFAENGGVAPSYGIDLEDGWEFMQDVVIRNNRFRDNHAGDLVICAGSELLIEGNTFVSNVVVHGRPHNYTFRNNQFRGGRIGYKTRTGVASIHDNRYENCSLSIQFDTAAVADGMSRRPGEPVPTRPLMLENEKLTNVKEVAGTYFDFVNASMNNVRFTAGPETGLLRLKNCDLRDSAIHFDADGPPVLTDLDGGDATITFDGPGLDRRRKLNRKPTP
ncbi:MAG: right-handed parallel beta-helix repeat-containing protein [Pirellulaceae bacterium]